MIKLSSAIRFLTLFPIGKPETFDARGMIPFFPLVGLILGGCLAIFDWVAVAIWSRPTAAALDVVCLAVLTAGLHLDGLADTTDGLYGGNSKEKALSIMKDSRVGAMGLVAVVCILLIKFAGIAQLNDNRALFLLIVPAYARCAMLFGFSRLPYGRPGGGTGLDFFENPLNRIDFWGLGLILSLSLLAGWRAVLLNLVFAAAVWGLLWLYSKRMGCITGDMLGAMAEVTEAVLFLAVSASI
jgi:adenosylcobinamide-GDP ribazoletransferase